MGNIIYVVFIIGGAVLFVLVTKSALDRTNAIPRNIKNIEQTLTKAGFAVSRKIGEYNKMWGAQHYFLYVDDINKKWLLTSPFSPEVNKILGFDELLDYGFFDEDGSDISGKIGRGLVGAMGAIGGAAVGGLVGGVLGGMGGAKATTILPGTKGDSVAYGLVLKTKDCDVNNPVLVFDFRKAYTEEMDNSSNAGDKFLRTYEGVTKSGLDRSTQVYKKDIAAIQEMAKVFDYIITSNAQHKF